MAEALPYFHAVDKAAAEDLISAVGSDGTFLVRPKGATPDAGYILSVVYKGKATHHALALSEGKPSLNKKQFGDHDSFGSLITHLGSKVKGWPVPLTSPVARTDGGGADGGDGGEGGGEAEAPTPAPAAAAVSTAGPTSLIYFHDINKAEAEKLIGGQADGTYLLRPAKSEEEWTLSVVYKKKPTHHAVKMAKGVVQLNKNKYGGHAEVASLIEELGTKTKGWPVPLSNPVENPENAAGGGDEDSAPAPAPAPDPAPAPAAAAPTPAAAAAPEPEPEPEAEPEPEPEPEPEKPPEPKVVPQWKLDKMARKAKEAREAAMPETNTEPQSFEPEHHVQSLAPRDFAQERARQREKEAEAAAERLAAAEANRTGWQQQALSAKAKKAPLPEAAKSPAKAALAARNILEEERAADKRADDEKIAAAKFAKAETKRVEKEEAAAAAEAEAKAAEEAAYLETLPPWKRDKLLRQRAADEAEGKRVAEDRARRLQEMRDDKARNLAQMETDRIQRAKDAEAAAKKAKREGEEAVERSIREVAETQNKFRSKLGGHL